MLKDFKTNKEELTKAALKMLHRIAFDLGCHSRLFLASLFQVLLRVDQDMEGVPKDQLKLHKHFELFQFGYHLFKKFLALFVERGDLLICEILFSKTAKECFDIDNGYGEYE